MLTHNNQEPFILLKGSLHHEQHKQLYNPYWQKIPSPAGKEKWYSTTVESILTNEKYMGAALLQKTFTADFLTKRKQKNNGEIPQYYVNEGHEAIIPPDEFEDVQNEIARRKEIGRSYSGNALFSAKIVCAECGHYFGAKVWHSTSKYRRVIWQCNGTVHNDGKIIFKFLDGTEIEA